MPDSERWRTIITTAVDAILTIDARGRIETFNPAAERLFGYEAQEVLGRNVSLLMPASVGRDHDSFIRSYLAGGEARVIGIGREVTGQHRDGTEIALYLSVGEMRSQDKRSFVGILRDIRPEHAAAEALRLRNEEYASVIDAMIEGVVVQRHDGSVLTVNAAAEQILGLTAAQLAGTTSVDPRWQATHEDGTPWPGEEHPSMVTLRTGQPIRGALMGVSHPSGQRVWISISTVPISLPDGSQAVLALFADITEQRRAAAALAESEQKYRLLTEYSSDLILRVDASGRVLYASPAARLFGYEPSALVGRLAFELLDASRAPTRPQIVSQVDEATDTAALAAPLLRGDGRWEWCEATIRSIRGLDGQVIERQASIRSIELQRRQALDLAAALARYQALADNFPGAVFLFGPDQRCMLAGGPAMTSLVRTFAPVGRLAGEIFSEELATRLFSEAPPVEEPVRTRSDGHVYDVTSAPVLSGGSLLGSLVLAFDVTERARLEAEQDALHEIAQAVAGGVPLGGLLELAAARIATLFDAVGAAIFRFEGKNARLLASAPVPPSEFLPDPVVPLLPTSAIGRVAASGRSGFVADYGAADEPLVRALRRLSAVGGAAAPILLQGRLWGAIGLGGSNPKRLTAKTAERLSRFAELVAMALSNFEARSLLERHASTDPLTQLPNRRVFDERLASEIERAERYGRPLSLVVFDIDPFKQINDALGHPAGDQSLVELSRMALACLRTNDLLCRIGGDEFALLLPETDVPGGCTVASRLRSVVELHVIEGVGTVTISLGVGGLHPTDSPDDLLSRADQALYDAKLAGRNAVRSRA